MIEEFINALAGTDVPAQMVNPYHAARRANDIRRHNLRLYFQEMEQRRPGVLLVAEAPGYRGCRLTGIPFASPALLVEGIDAVAMFGLARGYRPSDDWPDIRREASATIVWDTLARPGIRPLPVLWNACPFHPYRPEAPRSNRAPLPAELALGEPFLRRLLDMFDFHTVAAVGRHAFRSLTKWRVAAIPLRHPSHGGKRAFAAGVQALYLDAAPG